ncbi:Peptidyl-prolyl cis-trans isomerase PpiD [hydrothermal vent metagenome]|uniref:Periplasmic chaperone PpiD n=1 Tax=hydrothermal vent metagenome TaxID=652676 RepID=A0A3B0ZAS6_9ZZZZ
MLRLIRERAQGYIAWVIVILIIIPFALAGMNEYFETDSNVYVAKVNEVSIPEFEYRRVYQGERSFRQSLVGGDLNSPFMNEESIKRSALDRIVNTEVMSQAASENGFSVGDQLLLQAIAERGDFQTDGVFDASLYNNLLVSNNLSPADFEANVRREMMANQFVSGVMDLAIVTDYELDALLKIQEQSREIGYLVLKAEVLKALDSEREFSEEEIKAHYDMNVNLFALPEKVSLEYVELSSKDLLDDVQVDEEALLELYDDRIDSFGLPEERRARHILVNVAEDASEADVEVARSKATDLLTRVKAGESFETLAKDNSDDAGSAIDGGDLGFFGRGMMVTAFDNVTFEMQVGDVSELVKTPFGFHIIKLEEIREDSTKPFAEVREDLELSYREQQAEDILFDQLEVLSNLTYENPDSLVVAADQMELVINKVGFFDQNSGDDIASHSNVRKAAFSSEVMAGNNSEPLEVGENHMVVIRMDEHKPKSYRPLEEVRDDVIALLRDHTAKDAAASLGDSLLVKLKEGADATVIAAEHAVEWTKTALITRKDSSVNRELLNAAFRIAKPAEGETKWHGLKLMNGDYGIIALYQLKEGDLSQVDDATRESLKSTLQRSRSQSEGAFLVDSLKTRAEIKEYPGNL